MKRRIWRIIENVRTPPTTGIHPDNDNFACGWETCHMLLRSRIKRALSRKWWKVWAPKVLLLTLTLLLGGCSRTTATYKDGVATVTRTRILMTEDIDSFSYDASDGSFTFEGYKSDMTKALILIDKLTAKDEENKP